MTRDEAIAERDRLRGSEPNLLVTIREDEPGEWRVVTGRPRGLAPKRSPLTPDVRAGPQGEPEPTDGSAPPIWAQRGF
jgi:hypothetical protein